MEVIHDILKPDYMMERPTTVTIGNFDGVHRGHVSIINQMRDYAEMNDSIPAVITFDPHPLSIISPEMAPRLLSTTVEKLKLLEEHRVPVVILIPFSKRISQLSATWFLDEVLIKKLRAKRIVIGINHAFGKDREGNADFLKQALPGKGIELDLVKPFRASGDMVASSAIRAEFQRGDFETAAEMLGHPYPLFGNIISGKGIGSTLGYPTLNLKLDENKLIPPIGVYACCIDMKGSRMGGMLYVGTRPTFGGEDIVIEVSSFSTLDVGNGDFLQVHALKYFRPDKRFETRELLIEQLKKDEIEIKQYLSRQKIKLT